MWYAVAMWRLELDMRLENDQEGNTWFSTALEKPDVQLTMERDLLIAIGRPENIKVIVETKEE